MSQTKLCCCDTPYSHSSQINPLNLSHFWPLPLIPALLLPLPLSHHKSLPPPLSLPAPPSITVSPRVLGGCGSWAWSCCVNTQTSGVGSHHNQPLSTCSSLWMPQGLWQISLTPICYPHLPEHSHTLALKRRNPNPRPDGFFSLKPTKLFWICLYGMARCIQTETNFTSTNLSSHNFIFIQTEAFQATATKPFQYLISCVAWNSRDQQQLPGTGWVRGDEGFHPHRASLHPENLPPPQICPGESQILVLFQPSALDVTAFKSMSLKHLIFRSSLPNSLMLPRCKSYFLSYWWLGNCCAQRPVIVSQQDLSSLPFLSGFKAGTM